MGMYWVGMVWDHGEWTTCWLRWEWRRVPVVRYQRDEEW